MKQQEPHAASTFFLYMARAEGLFGFPSRRDFPPMPNRVEERMKKGLAFEGVHPTTLLQVTKDLAHRGTSYPDSPEELARVLNEQVRERTS